jgi:hypothetical protein
MPDPMRRMDFKLTEPELDWLDQLACETGGTRSSALRMLVRQAMRESGLRVSVGAREREQG